MSSAPPPGSETPPQQPAEVEPPAAVPQDTDDTRSLHFRRLIGHPVTLSLGATVAIAALVAGALAAGIAIGGAAPATREGACCSSRRQPTASRLAARGSATGSRRPFPRGRNPAFPSRLGRLTGPGSNHVRRID